MSRPEAIPSHLTFEEEPTDRQLQQRVGAAGVFPSVCWDEDDERVCLRHRPLPFWRWLLLIVTMMVVMTLSPWAVGDRDFAMPTALVVFLYVAWLVMLPVAVACLVAARRRHDRLGPGAIIDKRSRALSLPWIDRAVPFERIARFVEVVSRAKVHGSAGLVRQCGVVFREAGGRVVFAPVARLTLANRRQSCAARLADFYDLPLAKITASSLGAS